ncbi:hypothetical protein BZG36_00714 [Bifiguratus adelaidae]|uniref:Uncharacterized protein n=1 Tax=Bifiguratus adelaidae TaxID=1938954 RepID=A0A261Y785_9FUNG|nr:hypothetical protein BZG36_00714 [Bifiguratus adelaidae]
MTYYYYPENNHYFEAPHEHRKTEEAVDIDGAINAPRLLQPSRSQSNYMFTEYITKEPQEPIDKFLQRAKPSTTPSLRATWIGVQNPTYKVSRDTQAETSALREAKELLGQYEYQQKKRLFLKETLLRQSNGSQIGLHSRIITPTILESQLYNVAKRYNLVRGRWVIQCKPRNVDAIWSRVAKMTYTKQLGISAKVSTRNPHTDAFIISIYGADFDNLEDVARIFRVLKQDVDVEPLFLKAEFFDLLGIMSERNKYNIKPKKYTASNFEALIEVTSGAKANLGNFLRRQNNASVENKSTPLAGRARAMSFNSSSSSRRPQSMYGLAPVNENEAIGSTSTSSNASQDFSGPDLVVLPSASTPLVSSRVPMRNGVRRQRTGVYNRVITNDMPLAINTAEERLAKAKEHFAKCKGKEYVGHAKKVHTVSWNSDGRRLASGSVDKMVRIWTPEKGTDVRNSIRLEGHTDSVDQVKWDPTHIDRLATASCDKTVRIWDQRTGKCTATIETNGENINICWSPDGSHIAVGNKACDTFNHYVQFSCNFSCQDDQLSFIDTRTYTIENTIKYDVEVNEIAWSKTGDHFFLSTGHGNVRVLDYPSMKLVRTLRAHTASCYCLDRDPKGRYLATGSADALMTLWDLRDWTCIRTFGELDYPVRTISFSYDGEFLASASEDLSIEISHVDSGKSVHKIACHASMNVVAWHPSKYLLAYAGDEEARDPKTKRMEHAGNIRIFGFT